MAIYYVCGLTSSEFAKVEVVIPHLQRARLVRLKCGLFGRKPSFTNMVGL